MGNNFCFRFHHTKSARIQIEWPWNNFIWFNEIKNANKLFFLFLIFIYICLFIFRIWCDLMNTQCTYHLVLLIGHIFTKWYRFSSNHLTYYIWIRFSFVCHRFFDYFVNGWVSIETFRKSQTFLIHELLQMQKIHINSCFRLSNSRDEWRTMVDGKINKLIIERWNEWIKWDYIFECRKMK